MSTAAARHCGLPFVPQPAPDELLGSWLLRVAQLYGLGLTTLLSRLGARPVGDAHSPHWFGIDGRTVSLETLSAAARLSRVELAGMAPPSCRPGWPEELGACATCLAAAAEVAQPTTWTRSWMNPLATACSIHGTWLTPVSTRTPAAIRHAEDFGGAVQHVAADQALLDCEYPCAGDALWLQALCCASTDVRLPWGRTRPNDLTRTVDRVACAVMSASNSDSACVPSANRRALGIKDFAFKLTTGQRAVASLPTRLRQRQWVLGRVAHVFRWAPESRKFQFAGSAASVERLASMRDWPKGALVWVCPIAAELVRRQEELQRKFSISPRYFKAYSALLS
mgnify:CR=1 FL=1